MKNLRELFGWSQARLASYLGVSRSLLSLVELNLDPLPPTAGTKWTAWGLFAYGKEGALVKGKAALQLPLRIRAGCSSKRMMRCGKPICYKSS